MAFCEWFLCSRIVIESVNTLLKRYLPEYSMLIQVKYLCILLEK